MPRPNTTTFRDREREKLGARPYACDFHVHTLPDWRDSTGNKPPDKFIEEDYLPRMFQSGRQVIGIPQHNSIAQGGAKAVRDVARRMIAQGRQDIPIVFPGYELTSSDQIQVVLLANPDEDEINDLDTRVHQSLQLQQAQWHESGLTLRELLETVNDHFRQRLLALVVATGHKGILEDRTMANRHRNLFREVVNLADGFIISKPFAEQDVFTQRVLSGELQDYTKSAVPWLQTSDARTFAALSSDTLSFVKLGSFTSKEFDKRYSITRLFFPRARFTSPTTQFFD